MKRIFKRSLAAALSVAIFGVSLTVNTAFASFGVTAPDITDGHWETDNNGTKHFIYFYDQLTPEAKRFYNAMVEMYETGIFKTGDGEYSLTDNEVVTQEQLDAYTCGDNTLIRTYGAARDAFYADFPDVFYVDFDLLSIVVRQKEDGTFTATLGTGRTASYYKQGFTSKEDVDKAQAALNKAIDELVDIANEAVGIPDETMPPSGDETIDPIPDATPDITPRVFDMDELRIDNSEEEKYREKTPEEKKITAVHDALIRNTVYKLDTTNENEPKRCKAENIGHVRTAYGPLVAHESLCEGYSRAMKTVLDRAGVPCILVQGVYKHTEDSVELHMWNYVRVKEDKGNAWYAVDATFDDPVVPGNDDVNSGKETNEYLMSGADEMNRQHVPSGDMSDCGFEFTYPPLQMSGTRYDTVFASNGLEVQYTTDAKETFGSGMNTPAFKVSYNGKGYTRAAKEDGMYILVKLYGTSREDGSRIGFENWVYADLGMYDPQGDSFEYDDYTLFPSWSNSYAEFAVTDIPPMGHWYPGQTIPVNPQVPDPDNDSFGLEELEYQYYKGDPIMLEAQTGMLFNPEGTYMAPPYIKRATPTQQARLGVGGTYECEIVYDQPLVTAGDAAAVSEGEIPLTYGADFKIEVVDFAQNDALGNVDKKNVVRDAVFDGDRTIKFKFHPDESWAADCIIYRITLTSLQGKISGKTPNDIVYYAAHDCASCAYRARGYYWNLFAKPQLMENSDLSMNGWEDAQGNPIDESLSHRMTLVVSQTTASQDKTMNDLIESDESVDKVLTSKTYNISLTVCKSQVVKTGQSVRLCMGFPYPYGPDDEGVTFKAYHFIKDSQGNTIGVEEIPCEITRYGLVILCNSFSPFAVAAVETNAEAQQTKSVLLSNSYGGTVTAEGYNEFISLKEGESVTLTVTPSEGYGVEAVMAGDKAVTPVDNKITLKYEDIEGSDVIVDVRFAETAAIEKEETRAEETGEIIVQPETYNPKDIPVVPTGEITLNDDGSATATVTNNTLHSATVALMMASYENGTLKSVKIDKKTISSGGGVSVLKVSALEGDSVTDDMRVFLWDMDTMRPVTENFNK